MNTEQERADFEAWYVTDCERHGFQITVEEVAGLRGPHGDYRERAALHGKWVGWQARAALQSQDAERLDWLLRHLPGDAIRYCVGVISDTADIDEFRAAIDHARRVEGGGE